MKRWTKEEIEIARSLAFNNKTYQEIADELNRTKLSVERKLVRLSIKVRKQPLKEWPDDKVEYLKKHAGKKTYYELSADQFLNKSVVSIRKKTHQLNLKPKQHLKYKEVNHDFFKVWSEEMTYIFGFWCADGNIHASGKKEYNADFAVSFSSRDFEIIEKIKNNMCSTYKIGKNIKNMNGKELCTYRSTMYSKEIYNDIIKLGGCERKSLVLKFPTSVPSKYIQHFIRGYFDGDGSIRRTTRYPLYPSISIVGTYDFLSKTMTYLPIKTKIKPKKKMGIIDYHGKKAQEILHYMYNDANIYMERKYKRYQIVMKWGFT